MQKQPRDNQPSLAERIKAERARRGLSQSQAARAWRISVRTIQAWEQGRREPCGIYREAIERIIAERAPGKRR